MKERKKTRRNILLEDKARYIKPSSCAAHRKRIEERSRCVSLPRREMEEEEEEKKAINDRA
jgi:hypothetical protein